MLLSHLIAWPQLLILLPHSCLLEHVLTLLPCDPSGHELKDLGSGTTSAWSRTSELRRMHTIQTSQPGRVWATWDYHASLDSIQERKIIKNERRCGDGMPKNTQTREDLKVKVNIITKLHPSIHLFTIQWRCRDGTLYIYHHFYVSFLSINIIH